MKIIHVCVCVRESERERERERASLKTQLKSFFCDLLFSTKQNHPSYGKEHSVKM